MNSLLMLFSDYTFQVVALGSAVLGGISGVLGSYAVLRRQSLLGDGVSHAALPGVVLAFLLAGGKNTELLLLGALVSGLCATFFTLAISRNTRVKFDSALALVMSSFFGLGMVLLTYVSRIPNSNQAGLSRFIFGQASTLVRRDVGMMLAAGVIVLVLILVFWKEFKLFSFDAEYARTIGFDTRVINLVLSAMIVMGIIIGLQTVGVILMSAMLVAPAVAARQWTNRLWVMVSLSAAFGAAAGIAGTAASSLVRKLPTGPSIVIAISILVLFSLFFAPDRGMVYQIYRRLRNRKRLRSGQWRKEGLE